MQASPKHKAYALKQGQIEAKVAKVYKYVPGSFSLQFGALLAILRGDFGIR